MVFHLLKMPFKLVFLFTYTALEMIQGNILLPQSLKFHNLLRYDGTSDLATVESYDPITNSWQPEVSMGTRRSCLGVAVLHGLLYAAGGYDGASCLNRYRGNDILVMNAKHLHTVKPRFSTVL